MNASPSSQNVKLAMAPRNKHGVFIKNKDLSAVGYFASLCSASTATLFDSAEPYLGLQPSPEILSMESCMTFISPLHPQPSIPPVYLYFTLEVPMRSAIISAIFVRSTEPNEPMLKMVVSFGLEIGMAKKYSLFYSLTANQELGAFILDMRAEREHPSGP
jgi:hypothetical protein